MLKSTYKPSGNVPTPLPPGWTEHKAPTGHTYYYNSETKESTYKRPGPAAGAPSPPALPTNPHQQHYQYSSVPNLADPATANAFLAAYDPARQRQAQNQHGGRGGGQRRGDGRENRPRPQPNDKPRSRIAIPGCEPWVLVYTKYGRRFAYNPVKNASYWRIPEKVMKGVLELDIQGIKDKVHGNGKDDKLSEQQQRQQEPEEEEEEEEEEEHEELGSDYEEVEVTDDEEDENQPANADDNENGEHRSKRQRTEDPTDQDHYNQQEEEPEETPAEFNEEDIAFQLQAMGADYGLDPGEYDDGDPDSWPEGAEGEPLSDADARELFKDMLNDYSINPFSPWEKLIEEGRVFDDPRYTVLPTTKARREVWDEWSREKIQLVKIQRETEEKKDPRIPYMAFLQERATPKLYWPEFKRKYKREDAMRSSDLADKDREKLYRDHIARLKLPQDTLRKDLTALLKSVGLKELNNQTLLEGLPPQVITDVRFISLPPATRDPLVQAYIQTLSGPPDADAAKGEEEDAVARKKREDRKKREKALHDRERVVAEEKRRAQRRLDGARAMMREEERELEMAGRVDQDGLRRRLLAERKKESGGEALAGDGNGDTAMEES